MLPDQSVHPGDDAEGGMTKVETLPMTEHAELPWRVEVSTGEMDGRAKFETGSKVLIYSADCEHHPVADCSCNHSCRMPFEQEDNAALIVEAVNSYASLKARIQVLKEALKDLVEIDRRDRRTDPDMAATDEWREQAWANARAALNPEKANG